MRRSQRGAATAELAMGLPLLFALTVALVWLLSVGVAQVRLVDGAREAARGLARGDPENESLARATTVAGPDSRATVVRAGGLVTVTVTRSVAGPGGPLDLLPSVRLDAHAVAALERGP